MSSSGRLTGASMLRENVANSYKEAMKARDQRRVGALRLIQAAFKDRDIEARGAGKGEASEDELLQILAKMVRQREESIRLYEQGGRPELAEQERGEIEVIRGFMPQQLSEAELAAAVDDAVRETGAASVKDMGRVMALLRERYAGRLDLGRAGALVKAKLQG